MLLMFPKAKQCLPPGVKTILNRVIAFGGVLSNLLYFLFDRKEQKSQQGSFVWLLQQCK